MKSKSTSAIRKYAACKTHLSQEKDKERNQATEKLRRDMLIRIKETKADLLSLNEKQLQNTTKLTILQNH